MKVLFVCPFVPWPLETGGKIRTYHLIREAAKHAEIHLRVIQEPTEVPGSRAALEEVCASVQFFERSRPGPFGRVRLAKLERWFHSNTLQRALQTDLARGGFLLVHLDELLLTRIVKGPRIPVVQHHHKLDTVLYDTLFANSGPTRHFDRWKLHRLEAESARRYRHHILCSHEDAKLLSGRHGALDFAVVPSGFDPQQFRPSDPPVPRDPSRIVFVGSMDYGPNVDAVGYFCRSMLPGLVERRPETVFEIVGANPTPEVRALASENVNVTGRVDAVPPYLERAACVVVPLRIGGGTRLKIVEALALETPVVSTTIGAEGLGLEDEKHLVLADTPEDMVQAVERLVTQPRAAGDMARRGRGYVHERFRWEALGQDLVDYWERVAFSGTRSPSR
jgi:glycosyltransferase involved in cell wall biosynthesis